MRGHREFEQGPMRTFAVLRKGTRGLALNSNGIVLSFAAPTATSPSGTFRQSGACCPGWVSVREREVSWNAVTSTAKSPLWLLRASGGRVRPRLLPSQPKRRLRAHAARARVESVKATTANSLRKTSAAKRVSPNRKAHLIVARKWV